MFCSLCSLPELVSVRRCGRGLVFIASFISVAIETPPPPGMASSCSSSPRQDLHPLPLLQLQEVDSSKAPDRPVSSGLLPPTYSPPASMDRHAVCIPSPYTDAAHDYGHAPLAFYSPSVLGYPRAPVPDSPSTFWPPPQGHAPLPPLTLPCAPPLPYNQPWLEAKGHSINANRWVAPNLLNAHKRALSSGC